VVKNNLKSWQPGVSGNPKGRPKGSRNIKKVIQDMLNDPSIVASMNLTIPRATETPLEAIVYTLAVKAIRGDVRASEVLLRYSVDKDIAVQDGGFFNQSELKITIVGSDGNTSAEFIPEIDEQSGTMVGYSA
jgi:hypothetical protein